MDKVMGVHISHLFESHIFPIFSHLEFPLDYDLRIHISF
jgi:hypothetical protein